MLNLDSNASVSVAPHLDSNDSSAVADASARAESHSMEVIQEDWIDVTEDEANNGTEPEPEVTASLSPNMSEFTVGTSAVDAGNATVELSPAACHGNNPQRHVPTATFPPLPPSGQLSKRIPPPPREPKPVSAVAEDQAAAAAVAEVTPLAVPGETIPHQILKDLAKEMEQNSSENQAFQMMNVGLMWFRDDAQGQNWATWANPDTKHVDLTGKDVVMIPLINRSCGGERYEWGKNEHTREIINDCTFSIHKMLAHKEARNIILCL